MDIYIYIFIRTIVCLTAQLDCLDRLVHLLYIFFYIFTIYVILLSMY